MIICYDKKNCHEFICSGRNETTMSSDNEKKCRLSMEYDKRGRRIVTPYPVVTVEKSFSESKLEIINRKVLSITGVEKVYETNENKLQLKVAGSNLLITGEGLNISRLDVETGVVQLNGIINELKYYTSDNKGNIFKKLFK